MHVVGDHHVKYSERLWNHWLEGSCSKRSVLFASAIRDLLSKLTVVSPIFVMMDQRFLEDGLVVLSSFAPPENSKKIVL